MPRTEHCENGAFGGTCYYVVTDSNFGGNGVEGPWPTETRAKLVAGIRRKKGRDVRILTEEKLNAEQEGDAE